MMRIGLNRQRHRGENRRGAAAVEFALIVPVMLVFTFGLIEISRISMFKESLTQASREGARFGIRPGATVSEVESQVNSELSIMNIQGATIDVQPQVLELAQPGDTIRVRVSVPIGAAYVRERLEEVTRDEDLSRYIL